MATRLGATITNNSSLTLGPTTNVDTQTRACIIALIIIIATIIINITTKPSTMSTRMLAPTLWSIETGAPTPHVSTRGQVNRIITLSAVVVVVVVVHLPIIPMIMTTRTSMIIIGSLVGVVLVLLVREGQRLPVLLAMLLVAETKKAR